MIEKILNHPIHVSKETRFLHNYYFLRSQYKFVGLRPGLNQTLEVDVQAIEGFLSSKSKKQRDFLIGAFREFYENPENLKIVLNLQKPPQMYFDEAFSKLGQREGLIQDAKHLIEESNKIEQSLSFLPLKNAAQESMSPLLRKWTEAILEGKELSQAELAEYQKESLSIRLQSLLFLNPSQFPFLHGDLIE